MEAKALLSGILDEKSIITRIKPVAEVNTVGGPSKEQVASKQAPADVGEKIYEEVCKTCHATGLAGSPKFGDKSEWAPRIAEGIDTLVQHAIHGYKAMPPKGTCSTCSDDDIKKAVEYMVSHSK